MKKIGILLVAVLLGVAGWFIYQQPFSTYEKFRTAVEENNSVAFSQLVDKEQVATSLKQDLKAGIKDQTGILPNDFTKLAFDAIDDLIGDLIQPIMTPQGVYQLMTQGALDPLLFGISFEKPESVASEDNNATDILADTSAAAKPKEEKKTSALTEEMGYESFFRFKVRINQEGEIKPVIFTFERQGLFSWKLVRIGFGL